MKQKPEIIIYRTPQGNTKIDVRLVNETVWLTQKQLAELFQTTVPNINMHIKNILEEGELEANRTIQDFLIVQKEGIRGVKRSVEHYNLEIDELFQEPLPNRNDLNTFFLNHHRFIGIIGN